MADLSDALTALAQALADTLYPSGTSAPSAIGAPVAVFVGWPDAASLDADLTAGRVQVSVWPRQGMVRVTSRPLDGFRPGPVLAPTMTATISGAGITFAGIGAPGQIAGILADGRGWTALADGTPAALATALAATINPDRAATASGAVLTLPGAVNLSARVLMPATEGRTARWQAASTQVTIWAPTPALRDAVAALLDLQPDRTPWLSLPNGEGAHLMDDGTTITDEGREGRLHRRDLLVTLEYPTTDRRTGTPLVIPSAPLSAPPTAEVPNPPIRRVIVA